MRQNDKNDLSRDAARSRRRVILPQTPLSTRGHAFGERSGQSSHRDLRELKIADDPSPVRNDAPTEPRRSERSEPRETGVRRVFGGRDGAREGERWPSVKRDGSYEWPDRRRDLRELKIADAPAPVGNDTAAEPRRNERSEPRETGVRRVFGGRDGAREGERWPSVKRDGSYEWPDRRRDLRELKMIDDPAPVGNAASPEPKRSAPENRGLSVPDSRGLREAPSGERQAQLSSQQRNDPAAGADNVAVDGESPVAPAGDRQTRLPPPRRSEPGVRSARRPRALKGDRRDGVSADPPKRKPTSGLRLMKVFMVVLIFAMAVGFYLFWALRPQHELVPPMFMPQPYYYEEEQPVQALLLWREETVVSPVQGMVQLAAGQQASAVAAGDVVATVLSRGRGTPVRVSSRGYFLPALDGAEDSWDYSTLWLGSGLLPAAPKIAWVRDLAPLEKNKTVGKLIYLPQQPRAIFYLNLTDTLRAALDRGTISIRRESRGPKWSAHVRVFVKYDELRAKVCLDMPYFPIDMVRSRETRFLVCSDEDSGLIVPDTAVTIRNGTYGVFELVGDRIVFRGVAGKPVGDGMFFVSSGLAPGNPVILNAENAEEKRVRLW